MSFEALEASTTMWEYRGADGDVHGPFTSKQISDWKTQGFFTGASAVLMRKVILNSSKNNNNNNNNLAGLNQQQYKNTNTNLQQSINNNHKESPPIKKVKFNDISNNNQTHIAPKYDTQDFLNDMDDEGTEESNQQGIETRDNNSSTTTSDRDTIRNIKEVNPNPNDDINEWISSDDIDFGEYVELEGEEDDNNNRVDDDDDDAVGEDQGEEDVYDDHKIAKNKRKRR